MKKILILFTPVLILLFAFANPYQFEVDGTVNDNKGKPVAFASVVEKGTRNGTTTDANGYFKIKVASENSILIVSSVGFGQREIKLKGKSNLSIALKPAAEHLSEVVVSSAYGVKKESRIRGYSSANSNALYGKVAGVYIGGSPSSQVYGATAAPLAFDRSKVSYNGHADTTDGEFNTEDYDRIIENRFLKATDNPLSTFSIDVDAAAYSNIRRFIKSNQLPPAGAVRIEEMINYFTYEYEGPKDETPFAVHTELSQCPWNKEHRLVLVGLQGKKISTNDLPRSNIVFLIDVSGSMMVDNKLPLVKSSLKLLVDQLREEDKVSMVVYAGNAGLVLPSTSGAEKMKIKDAIDRLEAGGSTAGGAGIKLAYKVASENFMKEGNNRVILCTDGDFNIGVSSDDELERMIEQERQSGVFLTVLGYGMGNYKDNKMQKLADKGNGNHAYIDGISEAKKVLVNEFGGTLFTIAKDVKLQIEFNPQKVQGYRLIGYENRMLTKEDFNNDKKDAGELGSGHTVTALYEVIPAGVSSSFIEKVDDLRYQKNKTALSSEAKGEEIMNIKLRFKAADSDVSKLIEHPVPDRSVQLDQTTDNFRFAAAVAEFGLLLRNSEFKSQSSYDQVLALARKARGEDTEGYRKEFIKLVSSVNLLVDHKNEERQNDSSPVSKN